MSDNTGFVTPPPAMTHDPCCSSHGARLDCEAYRRSHFVEVGPCCEVWAEEHPEYGTAAEPTRPESVTPPHVASASVHMAGLAGAAVAEQPAPGIESALRQIAAYRQRNDSSTQTQAHLGDRLAAYVTKQFPPEEREIAGKAIVHAASAIASLVKFDITPALIANVHMFAGERMVAEARGRKDGDRG